MPWRGGAGAINTTMRFRFHEDDEAVSLYISAMPHGGTFFHNVAEGARDVTAQNPIAPYQRVPVVDPANLATANVKRVIAMTRAATYNAEVDGAEMSVTFGGGRVRLLGAAEGGWWHANCVNQSVTGYDAPGNGASNDQAWDMRVPTANNGMTRTDGSRTIVEFPNLDVGNLEGRTDSAASRGGTEGGNSRYIRETVRINLRPAARPEGANAE